MQQKGATKLCKVYNLYTPRQEPRRAAIFARLEEMRAAADVIGENQEPPTGSGTANPINRLCKMVIKQILQFSQKA